jgi:acyl-CoA synthetase (AMP-forming)/AMP-acid ligase II/thioesterase domain-containing protein/acyl carrier protein
LKKMQKSNNEKLLNYTSAISNKKLAISKGSEVSERVEIPHIPAEALKYGVELNLGNELIFIQADGSEVVQTYTQIWERAQRILGGSRAFGLQPGEPIILQVDTSQDFAPALWSCIMGGFVPVPVPITSDYSKPNKALSRLDRIWQQLDSPTIVTSSKLASQIHTGLQLYGKQNVKIATIEELETHSPHTRLHQTDELALLLPSSGTTGQPKLVKINSQTFIYRFLKDAINQNNNSPAQTLLSWFPLESISGIFTTLPNRFQKNIYLPAELLIRNPLLWLDTLSKHQVTHAQTTNFILASILDQLMTNPQHDWDFSSVQRIGIGAEPIVAKTARSFLEILSKYNLNFNVLGPAYGMTECGPIAGSREGFSLTATSDSDRFVEIGEPTRGHSIRIVDQQGSILEEGQIGRIQVTGPSMTSGYYQAPELTRELFTEDGWINTGDLGFLQDGKLTVTGREKEIIIINARNYSCHEIELVAEEVEGVEPSYTAACAIRQSNSETDELVIFFHSLVSKESHLAQLLKQIRRNIAEKLGINPTYLIPIEKSTIPRTATGKIQRLQLKQLFDAGEFEAICQQVEILTNQEQESNFVEPRENLELEVTKIWEQVLGKQPIGVRDNFFDLGGDSLLAVRLLAQIEKAFGKNLPLATLFQLPTVEQQAKILHQSGWSSPWFSLVPIQPSGSQPPFFGIHSLGKGQEHYRNIARHLGSDQPIYGLDYWLATQTKDTKELPKTWSVEELAAHYIKEMRILQPEGPYFLAGLSFAGLVAYEMAQQLVTQDQKVALLVLFDTHCPTLSVKSLDFNPLQIHLRNLSQLEMKEKLAYIMTKVKYKIQQNLKLIKLFFRKVAEKFYLKFKLPMPYALHYSLIVEANQKLAGDYALQAYPGKVTLFRVSDQPVRYDQISDLGWSALAVGGVEIHEVPGGHMGMFQEPHVQMLAEKLRVCIDKALQDVSEKE